MLEDEYSDIIRKASRGLVKKVNSEDIEESSKELKLNFEALKNIKYGKYKPKKFDFSKKYEGLRVEKISSPFMEGEVNAYVVLDEDNACVIIDTAQVPERIIEFVKRESIEVKYLLKTHEHQDHVEGVEDIQKEVGGEVLDFDDMNNNIFFGQREIKIFRTPGHSEKSLTFQIGKFLFVGDSIFAGSLGGGMYSYEKLLESAKKILSLDEDLIIFPGHGPATTIKEETKNNAFIN
jgi:hydroxyacylglutathione hydrolase